MGHAPKGDDDFVFHATDKKGHCAQLRIAVPPDVDQTLTQIIEQHQFPYRTKADIVRDALYHRLKWLDDNHDIGVSDVVHKVRMQHILYRSAEDAKIFKEMMNNLRTTLEQIQDDREEQVRLVSSIAYEVISMPNGYWRDYTLENIMNSYGSLLSTQVVQQLAWETDK